MGLTLELVARHATEIALRDGSHQPTLIVESDQNQSGILQFGIMPGTFAEREQQMFTAGFVFSRRGEVGALKQVFFITEGWMSLLENDQTPEMRPSEDPKRKEVLLISQMNTQNHQQDMVIYEMLRDDAGALQDLLEFKVEGESGEEHMESPLLEAFVLGYQAGFIDNATHLQNSPN